MITYVNVDRNNDFVYNAPEKIYKKGELFSRFQDFIGTEGFSLSWVSNKAVPYVAVMEKDEKN